MSVDLDWKIEDEEAPPAALEAAEDETPVSPGRRRWRVLAITAFLFLAVAVVGLWLVQEQGRRQLEQGLRATILMEAQALARGDREIFLGLQDPDDPGWREAQRALQHDMVRRNVPADQVEVLAVGIEGDWAWAEVRAPRIAESVFDMGDPDANVVTVTDQVQFYRRVEDRWKRAAPDASFLAYWGQPATLEMGHLRIQFFERDRPQIEAWLAALAPYTEEVCLDLGCPDDFRLTAEISPTLTLTEALQWLGPESERPILPSPHTIGIRQDYPLGEPPVILALDFSMVAIIHSGGSDAFFSEGRDIPGRAMVGRAVLYREFDRAITALALPQFEANWAGVKKELMGPLLRGQWISLAQFDATRTRQPPESEGQIWTLIEYVAEAYGRGRVGDLLRAAQDAGSLSEALRLGLHLTDLDAFERGWRQFVEARFRRAMRDAPLRP